MTRTRKRIDSWKALETAATILVSFVLVAPVFDWMLEIVMTILSGHLYSWQINLLTSLLALAIGYGILVRSLHFMEKAGSSPWILASIIPMCLGIGWAVNGVLGLFVSLCMQIIESWPT